MTEEQAEGIARQFITREGFRCTIASISRLPRREGAEIQTVGDRWVVEILSIENDGGSPLSGMIIIDDATGIAQSFETL